MATVFIEKRKRDSGMRYIIYYKNPMTGQKTYYKTMRKLSDAQQSMHKLRALIDNGGNVEPTRKKLDTKTFSEVAESLKEEWARMRATGNLSEKTRSDYVIWLNVLSRRFGNKILCGITESDIRAFIEEESLKNSNVSANRYLRVLRHMFRHGIKIFAAAENPAERVKYLSEKDHERNIFILPDKLNELIEASKQVKGAAYLPALILLGAEHGASKQECLSLKWTDIDFDFQGQGLIMLRRTKNKRARTELLMPRSREALLSLKNHQEFMRKRKKIKTDSQMVFNHLDGRPLKRFCKSWKAACRIAGLENFHFHDLRHTFCSNLILSGASLKEVKDLIGHSDITMTDRYSHLADDVRRKRMDVLARHYAAG
jgi:integrase